MTTSVPLSPKPKSKHEAFDAIGKAVDGLTYSEVLGILSAVVGVVIEGLPKEVHEEVANNFCKSILPPSSKETMQ